MLMYSLLFLVPAAFWLLPRFTKFKGLNRDDENRVVMMSFFIVLLFLLSLRAHSVGRDTVNYVQTFKRFSHASMAKVLAYKEPAFALLCKGVSLLTDDFQWLVAIVALISVLPIMVLYWDKVEYPMTSIALFVTISNFYMLFSGLRQTIAISIGILAYLMTRRRKPILFLLLVILAFFFHRSSMILIVMYPLYHMRLVKRSLFYVVPILLLIFVFNRQIFSFLQGIVQDYENIGNRTTGAVDMLLLLIAFSVFAYMIPDDDEMDDDTIGLRNFLLMATVVQMFAPLNYLVMRMGYFYMIFLPLTLPKIIARSSVRWKQVADVANYVIFAFFTLRFFVNAPVANALDIFPYRFFWEMM